MSAPKRVTIFTDGACSGNPGPGGWAAVLTDGRMVRELAGASARTTNNRMELEAVIQALKTLDAGSPYKARDLRLELYTDSTYVICGVTEWLRAWKRRGWTTAAGEAVLNRDLWEELDRLAAARAGRIHWHYVRGHRGVPGNCRADALAVSFARDDPETLYSGPAPGYPYDLLRLPQESSLPNEGSPYRAPGRGPKRAGGFYVSLVDGRVERHLSWQECQARVHGKSRARFKKVFSEEEARETLRRWGF